MNGSLQREVTFEREICEHLAASGWLYDERDADDFDRPRALYPLDVLAWVHATDPKAWESLQKNHGDRATETLLNRLRDQLDQRGTLDVLRNGVELLGLKQPLRLAQFKPALGMNPDILARYAANRLRVVRQVRYSLHHENCIDPVLFLNGVPVATFELKTNFTQSVEDAIDQYRFDRLPKTKGKPPEPLLSFPSGALVHFAVSNSEVYMTTQLAGPATQFLPFNQGNDGGAGNPPNPGKGHRTGYLWEQVWQRDSWMEILGRYLIGKRDEKKKIREIVFPWYHQLDVTREHLGAVVVDGIGGGYLVQRSAGSGKTNSIAWTAHFFAELHDAEDRKFFDSVLVVSDRTVIDSQLQEALFDFQRQVGVVATIKGNEGSKSGELAEALSGAKKIVVCTIQTFPFALETVRELAATQGKRFAVIADEAHSSQAGEAAAKLKSVLSPEEIRELNDGGEVTMKDILASQMSQRADRSQITYVAFTATPKAKTLELFGRRPHPTKPAGPDNLPAAFHVYSMRQAIEEKFILDGLQNYTTYVIDFVNPPDEILAAFKTYHTAAQLADTTDPNLIFNLRSKLDASRSYDDFEADRVVAVELNPSAKQGELLATLEPVVDRLTEIIAKVNDLFEGELTDQDKLVYVNNVLLGKLLESETIEETCEHLFGEVPAAECYDCGRAGVPAVWNSALRRRFLSEGAGSGTEVPVDQSLSELRQLEGIACP